MKKSIPDCLLEHLPDHEKIEEIPQAFSDSTHQLWLLKNTSSEYSDHILKVCSNTQSSFWQIMKSLFDYDLEVEIINFSITYDFLDQACSLEIPKLIKADRCRDTSYILTNANDAVVCDSEITKPMVIQLAKHLAELHSLKSKQWGSLNEPKYNTNDWPKRLKISLKESAKKWGGVFSQSEGYLKQAVEACDAINTTEFVAMIPDLRWDQFLQKDNKLTTLVDLDAFVYAPRELDFVILEFILSSKHLKVFKETYSKYHSIPDIKAVRKAYRLLLFYMQILGEPDLDDWMKKIHYF